jgi:putative CocE/NonD family hydrolase
MCVGGRTALGVLATAALAYRWRWRIIGRLLRMPPVRYPVGVKRDIPVRMPDGIVLMTDHYYPKGEGKFPTILMRSAYGRGGDALFPLNVVTRLLCQLGAERGYNVISQTTRGRSDSGGHFEPFVDARADGLATLQWISEQPWFDGSVGMVGASYGGYVQWAVAADAPPYLKALAPFIITTRVQQTTFAEGALGLDTSLRWMRMLDIMAAKGQQPEWKLVRQLGPAAMAADLAAAFYHLPLAEADRVAVGREVDYYRNWIDRTDPDDPVWRAIDHSDAPARAAMPIHLISGWYDLFLSGLLDDYADMKAASRAPYLTIGPWSHTSLPGFIAAARDSLIWLDAHLKGDKQRLRKKPVRLYVMGANRWQEMDEWPPVSHHTRYYLHGQSVLYTDEPEAPSQPDMYRYDPANPTPTLGGPLLMRPCGPVDNRPLERRPDVITYTTAPLEKAVEIIGAVKLDLYVRSSLAHTDFFARLCDVYPDGRSINICEGLCRVQPGVGEAQPDGSILIEVDMWATAYRFHKGHRIRLQVSSGSHPRWSRNLGTGEPLATGTRMQCADQAIYHDNTHLSALVLPVFGD